VDEAYILVVGVASIDVKGHLLHSPEFHTSNPGRIQTSEGGTGYNIAVNLAQLDQPVVLLSVVGDDPPGSRILTRAAAAGVDIAPVIVTRDCGTASYVAVLDQRGELTISVDDMAALDVLTPQIIYQKRGLIRAAAMVVIDSNLSPAAMRTIFKQAASCGVPVVADPTSTVLAKKLRPNLSHLHLVTPNIPEAQVLTGKTIVSNADAIAAAKHLVKLGVDIAIITLAELGVVYATREVSGHIPAVKTAIVDLTGAGDALTAAVVFGLLSNFPIDEALRLGASAAALTLRVGESVYPDLSLDKLYDNLVI
jgi:pseudouridine kinase